MKSCQATPRSKPCWRALKSDRTLMLGLDGVEDGHARPMTAQFEKDPSPIWFFASTDNELVKSLPRGVRAIATFASKGHDLYATLHGKLSLDNDRATSTGCGTATSPPGWRAARTTRSLRCCAWTRGTPKSGSTNRVCSPASSFCSAPIQRKNIRIRSPKSAFADARSRR